MKAYQKAEMIAKNLPTGSYAAGCPTGERIPGSGMFKTAGGGYSSMCSACEIAQ